MNSRFLSALLLVLVALMFTSCQDSKDEQAVTQKPEYSKDYIPNLRSSLKIKDMTIFNGEIEPKVSLVITNTGTQTVTKVKLFCKFQSTAQYSDEMVVEKNVAIGPSATQEVEIKFKKQSVSNPKKLMASSAIGNGPKINVEFIGLIVK